MQDPIFTRHSTDKALAFSPEEYEARLEGLRDILDLHGLDAIVLTSGPGVGYWGGLLPGAFGRAQGVVVTALDAVVVTAAYAGLTALQSSPFEAVVHDDHGRDRFWRAVAHVTGPDKAIGVEADSMTMVQADMMTHFLRPKRGMDIAPATRTQRLVKSDAELSLIQSGVAIAQAAQDAVGAALRAGARAVDLEHLGRETLCTRTARQFPDLAPTGGHVWVQSGPGTDGIWTRQAPRKIKAHDPVNVTCLAMIAGYAVPVSRSFVMGADQQDLSRTDRQRAVLAAIRPGVTCAELAALYGTEAPGALGHSVGLTGSMLVREAGLDLRADNDTALEVGMVLSLGALETTTRGGHYATDVVIVMENGAEVLTGQPPMPVP